MAKSPRCGEPGRGVRQDQLTRYLSGALLFSGTLSQICQCYEGVFWVLGVFFLLDLVANVSSVKFLMDSAAMQSEQGQQHPVRLSASSKINYLTAQIFKAVKS